VEHHGATYHLELEVCQVDSGRVESLAREIEPAQATTQIGEMLALLLRAEGIANADIPWERAKPPAPAEPPPPTTPPPLAAKDIPPTTQAAPRHTYAENHPIGVGAGASVLAALARPSHAVGSATALLIDGAFGYAIESLPGLEIRADASGSIAGPKSASFDAGARYLFALAPAQRIFVGPEAAIGAFFPIAGDTSGRFLARGSAVGAMGLGEQVQIEIAADVAAVVGRTSLVLAGGTARGLVRF
jgi:hypothetical protein